MTNANTAAFTNDLFDLLVAHPQGITLDQAAHQLGTTRYRVKGGIHRLRLIFADSDTNVIADPSGNNTQWLYKLVGSYADARGWMANRLVDLESRLQTNKSVALSISHAADGRTIEGKKAKKIARTLERLEEDLAEISAG